MENEDNSLWGLLSQNYHRDLQEKMGSKLIFNRKPKNVDEINKLKISAFFDPTSLQTIEIEETIVALGLRIEAIEAKIDQLLDIERAKQVREDFEKLTREFREQFKRME